MQREHGLRARIPKRDFRRVQIGLCSLPNEMVILKDENLPMRGCVEPE